jgi:two-component system, chemotaxis family, protein-glutamate methylesterase/glutaminase
VTRFEALTRSVDAVVIGTSAGGVEALTELLPALRATTQIAVFIVLHLPRDRESLLVEIFASRCALPVTEAIDKEPVVPGMVYFAPPDYHLLLEKPTSSHPHPHIALSADEEVHFSRPSVDVLFEAAAEAYGPRLLGILLTGANADGAAGLEAVQAGGGVTVVQDPRSAQSPAMALAALRRFTPDHVLSLAEIAELLATLEGQR